MGGAIAIRGFELKHDLAGPGAAEPFVAEGRTRDVATEAVTALPSTFFATLRRPVPSGAFASNAYPVPTKNGSVANLVEDDKAIEHGQG